MDIDRVETDERSEHIKKGLCFYCHEGGHLARDCPKKRRGGPSRFRQNKTKNKEEAWAKIRAIYHELEEDEQEKLMETMAEQDF